MPFIYTEPQELTIDTNGIVKGDRFLVSDGKSILPISISIEDATASCLKIREHTPEEEIYWIRRSDLPKQYELVDVFNNDADNDTGCTKYIPNTGKLCI